MEICSHWEEGLRGGIQQSGIRKFKKYLRHNLRKIREKKVGEMRRFGGGLLCRSKRFPRGLGCLILLTNSGDRKGGLGSDSPPHPFLLIQGKSEVGRAYSLPTHLGHHPIPACSWVPQPGPTPGRSTHRKGICTINPPPQVTDRQLCSLHQPCGNKNFAPPHSLGVKKNSTTAVTTRNPPQGQPTPHTR